MAPKFPAVTYPIHRMQYVRRILPNYSIKQMNNRDKAGKKTAGTRDQS